MRSEQVVATQDRYIYFNVWIFERECQISSQYRSSIFVDTARLLLNIDQIMKRIFMCLWFLAKCESLCVYFFIDMHKTHPATSANTTMSACLASRLAWWNDTARASFFSGMIWIHSVTKFLKFAIVLVYMNRHHLTIQNQITLRGQIRWCICKTRM